MRKEEKKEGEEEEERKQIGPWEKLKGFGI